MCIVCIQMQETGSNFSFVGVRHHACVYMCADICWGVFYWCQVHHFFSDPVGMYQHTPRWATPNNLRFIQSVYLNNLYTLGHHRMWVKKKKKKTRLTLFHSAKHSLSCNVTLAPGLVCKNCLGFNAFTSFFMCYLSAHSPPGLFSVSLSLSARLWKVCLSVSGWGILSCHHQQTVEVTNWAVGSWTLIKLSLARSQAMIWIGACLCGE